MSIDVRHITKLYGPQKALDDVTFIVHPGEVVGLIGPNGAGKTTLMKIITCFIPPTAGEVSVYGFDIFEHSIDIRKRIGYLPENNPLYLDMYVKEYLYFIAGLHKLGKNTRRRVDEIIGITGLQAEQNKKIGALSKGYRQRAGLAQALIHNPEVLILDEPTSGLDPNQLIEIRNLIKEIGKEKTVMLSTHIMQEVDAVCGRVIIIDNGKIVADDLTVNLSHLAQSHESVYVEFNSDVDIATLQAIPGIIDIVKENEFTWIIHSRAGHDIRPDIFNFAVNHHLTVLSLKKEGQSLEKVFQTLTKKPGA
jgi:ABC-2 type transport system ATP-binding protein